MIDFFRINRHTFLLFVVLMILSLCFYYFAPPHWVSRGFLFIAPFFVAISSLSKYLLFRKKRTNQGVSSLSYIIILGGKLLISIAILVVYGIIFEEGVASFFLSFLVFYLIFSYWDARRHREVVEKGK